MNEDQKSEKVSALLPIQQRVPTRLVGSMSTLLSGANAGWMFGVWPSKDEQTSIRSDGDGVCLEMTDGIMAQFVCAGTTVVEQSRLSGYYTEIRDLVVEVTIERDRVRVNWREPAYAFVRVVDDEDDMLNVYVQPSLLARTLDLLIRGLALATLPPEMKRDVPGLVIDIQPHRRSRPTM